MKNLHQGRLKRTLVEIFHFVAIDITGNKNLQ
jgi:hypothetical protein